MSIRALYPALLKLGVITSKMKLLKILLKSILVVAGLFILFLVFILMGENYETVIRNQNNTIVRIEIKKVFGKKVSEATLDSPNRIL